MKAKFKKRRAISVCCGALLWGATSVLASQNAMAQTTSSFFFIQNIRSGKCIDVDGLPGVNNGAKLQLWNCEFNNGYNTDQVWRYYYITGVGTFIQNRRSSKCIDVDGLPGVNNGAKLQLWDCEFNQTRTTDQMWFTFGSSGVPGETFIQNRGSFNKCIDADGLPGVNNGTRLQLWDCETTNRNTDQTWRFVYL